jgi:hypothetical protein
VAFAPDGSLLASGARDGKVRLHSRSGRLLRTDAKLGGAVTDVGFAADGSLRAVLADGRERALPAYAKP